MIGSLRGTVVERRASGEVLLEVGGVGYRILVTAPTLTGLQPGEAAFLFTHLHVREDALVVYGFTSREERDTFELLLGASGVGPKLGLAILSVHAPAGLRRAVLDGDLDALVLVPGVGRRTAARLLVELKARLDIPDLAGVDGTGAPSEPRAEVREALVALGYQTEEVRGALADLPGEGSVEEMLRGALRLLAVTRA